MKLIIIAGTPGSGKTSIIKHVIEELKTEFKLLFAKFDCLKTQDETLKFIVFGPHDEVYIKKIKM